MEQILSKAQARVFIALAQQRQELQGTFREILEAEHLQVEMLRKVFGLPDGEYQIRQDGGDLVLFRVEQEESPAD